jgi:hypothetical protein
LPALTALDALPAGTESKEEDATEKWRLLTWWVLLEVDKKNQSNQDQNTEKPGFNVKKFLM